ncbi:MAG: MFS transporter [Chloroflexota bacterium]|nr:MFS transporter [Chloroflexota bacterium]
MLQPTKIRDLGKEQRKIINAWCIYDWANSVFSTSGIVAIFPVYFVFLFEQSIGSQLSIAGLNLSSSGIWSIGISISSLVVALTSPPLGILADKFAIKRKLLIIYCVAGSIFTALTFFSVYTSSPWAWLLGFFILANIGFNGSFVFYNSFLPHIAPKELLDDVSSRGYAFGYIGGGLLLLIHLVVIMGAQNTSIEDLVTRACMVSIGIWWFGFSLWTFKFLPEPTKPELSNKIGIFSAIKLSIVELSKTFQGISKFKPILIYLLAFLLFNDGIQTILSVAGAYAADTLGVSLIFNMLTILLVQFIAAPGAQVFSLFANRSSTKNALMTSLTIWCIIILVGIGMAPLSPSSHTEHDYQLEYTFGRNYEIVSQPSLSESLEDKEWDLETNLLSNRSTLSTSEALTLIQTVNASENSQFSASISGGPHDGLNAIGKKNKSNLSGGPLDWWPNFLRTSIWEPLNLSINFQFLLLGSFIGLIMGGSQALARSIFAHMTPENRSGEFFSFFGFTNKVSSVIGPMLYVLISGTIDTRTAILSIMIIIAAGALILSRVDVDAGKKIALINSK